MLGDRIPGLDELKKFRDGLGPLGTAFPPVVSFDYPTVLSLLFSRSWMDSKFFKFGTLLRKADGL